MTPPQSGRRQFLVQTSALAAGLATASASLGDDRPEEDRSRTGLTETSLSPHAIVRGVGLTEAKWTRGFWADRFATCRDSSVPALWRLMNGTEPTQFLHNFRIAAGLAEGQRRGPSFNDGDFYKWLEAASVVFAQSGDRALGAWIDEAIGIIALAQRSDGYLHTPVLIRNRHGDAAKPFSDRLQFEAYNLGHLITAACVHHRATGKTSLLDVAVKAGSFLQQALRDQPEALAKNAVCPSHYMALVELYRTTRDPKHLELARALFDLRDRADGGSDDNQDRIPFRRQAAAVGHAVRANYLYAGAADLLLETGDRTLEHPLAAIWENMVTQKMYITGGCGALYDGASPDGARDQASIARVHQAYGRSYQLPNSAAHNETCAAVGSILWNWRMLALTGEARFADVLEIALYNAALAASSLDGTNFFYVNTLRQLDTMPVNLRWSRTRQPFISSFCCPPNLVRTLAEASCYAYGRSAGAVWVHLYGSSVLETEIPSAGRIRLTQETDYPWDGRVRLTVNESPARACSLRLRIPGWVSGATVSLNGTAREGPVEPGSYLDLNRTWSKGDVVELKLPLVARLMQAHPLVEEARQQVAVQRGPLVYCLESVDLLAGVRVLDVAISRQIALEPRFDAGLLGGVTVLEGRAEARSDGAWSKQLYRELPKNAGSQAIDLRLIPYFAWGNRGPSEMTVWMPLVG